MGNSRANMSPGCFKMFIQTGATRAQNCNASLTNAVLVVKDTIVIYRKRILF